MSYIKLIRKSAVTKPLKANLGTYPDGTLIPAALPVSYAPVTPPVLTQFDLRRHCGDCVYFSPATQICSAWGVPVRGGYICAKWAARPGAPAPVPGEAATS